MAENVASICSNQVETFGIWSRVYDRQPNPFLSLEERVLQQLLPDMAGRDVLDLGCGTGRWLSQIERQKPSSLVGVDISPEMLAVAKHKIHSRTRLICGGANCVRLPDQTMDVIIASFLVAHVDDLDGLARECRRVLRDRGQLFISDLHPDTVRALAWDRAFRAGNRTISLHTNQWSLETLRKAFETAGLCVVGVFEPQFSRLEHRILASSGMRPASLASQGKPALIVLQLQTASRAVTIPQSRTDRAQSIIGASIAVTGEDSVTADLELTHSRISAIGTYNRSTNTEEHAIDLHGYTLLPGLVNSHDHLDFGLFPRLGNGPYSNFREWFEDIHKTECERIALHRAVPKDIRIWWGAVRNLLCGVTTVCHHNPLSADMLAEDFPIRVVREFGWAHSVALDGSFAERHHRTRPGEPFLIHAGEGIDELSRAELRDLERSGAMDERTVIVHGLACSFEVVQAMNRRGSALVWCPSSNSFLFARTHSRESLARVERVAIGSDSSLTSKGDFLDEIAFARRYVGVPAKRLYEQATSDAAHILRIKTGAGHIRIGGTADLIGIKTSCLHPSDALTQMSFRELHLVLKGGRVQLASPELMHRIPPHLLTGLRPIDVDGTVRWIRVPLGRIFGEAARILGCNLRLNGRRVRHVCSDWL